MIKMTFIMVLGFVFACSSTNNRAKKNDSSQSGSAIQEISDTAINYLKIIGDSVEIPSFEIKVELDYRAEYKLKRDNETVIVIAMFFGVPIGNIPDKYRDRLEANELLLREYQIELKESRIARFENIKFSKELYDLLVNKDIELVINIFSGRKSIDVNLLFCDVFKEPMSKIKGKTFVLKGTLINKN